MANRDFSDSGWTTILDALDTHTQITPERPAFRFLGDGTKESAVWSYGDLSNRTNAIAALLASHAKPGDRALLLYPPGLDFIAAFLGCLRAGVVAVPLYAPHPRRPDERLTTVAQDCAPKLVLSDAATLIRIAQALDREPALDGVSRLATDALTASHSVGFQPRSNQLAFIQYSSGSTSAPNGICITHANLMTNEAMIQDAMRIGQDSVVISWLPTHHDMGLIGDTLQPIFSGCVGVKMPAAAFLQHPRRWLDAVTKYRGTITGGPNFAFDLCVQRISDEERRSLDLGSLRVAYCGSEPVRPRTLQAFADAFSVASFNAKSFFPCYGLAEATLFASGGPAGDGFIEHPVSAKNLQRNIISTPESSEDTQILAASGQLAKSSEFAIVDPLTRQLQKPSDIGEIWLRGPHIAAEYWNKPELTKQRLRAFDEHGRGPFLATGDLGYVENGQVYVTGRIKDLIIIRGRNHYPQDIEQTASRAHPLLMGHNGAAFSVEEDGTETIVIVHEIARSAREVDFEEARKAATSAVSETHGVQAQVRIVKWGSVPKTSSGKVRRAACKELYLRNALPPVEPRNERGAS
jgi:acyl-CoA synthetase (AMP-forming)/AMP-acid ligase II